MNVLKNMEAIFLATAFLAGATSYASAAIPAAHARYNAQVSVGTQQVAVVKVSAKRVATAD
jgi:hypothetical protein